MTTPPFPGPGDPFRGTVRLAAAFLLVALCWVFTNPGGAAPDESDHLVKSLGNVTGQLGERPDDPGDLIPLLQRNESTTRVYRIPARLAPKGMTCYAFVPTTTADCQAENKPGRTRGERNYSSAVGDYPAFLYLPIGAAALLARSTYEAFIAGRLVVAALSVGLLWIGMAQLARWLGRRAVLAYAVLLSPVAVFVMSSVSTSGIELASGAAVATVVTTCALRPDAVHRPSTHWTFLAAGACLALSRQLGVLALGIFCLVLLASIGWVRVRTLVRERQTSFLAAVVVVGLSVVAALWWERSFDHPAGVGTPFSGRGLAAFLPLASQTLNSAVGTFGWLDTVLPSLATGAWLAMWVVAIAVACLIGSRRETRTIIAMTALTVLLAIGIYISAFYPIGAGIQGRHFLPLFSLSIILSVAVVVRSPFLGGRGADRVFLAVAVLTFVVQFVAIWTNARRYAVGVAGPWWFVPDAKWSPVGGWVPWLLLSLVATGWLSWEVRRLNRLVTEDDVSSSPAPPASEQGARHRRAEAEHGAAPLTP